MTTLNEPNQASSGFALFNLGFRAFFAGAGLLAVAAITLWTGMLHGWQPLTDTLNPIHWHAHEMIFGYGAAVAAGFLLTAVRNWTGLSTPQGIPLALIFCCWLLARIAPFLPLDGKLLVMATFDLLFLLGVIIGISLPILKAKQTRQFAIVLCIVLLMLSNALFYFGLFDVIENGTVTGLYSGLYLIIGLILILGGRVIPFFIERGIGRPVELPKRPRLDITSLLVFVLFWLVASFSQQALITALLATVLCVLHALRLSGWWVAGIEKKPMLWVLWLGYSLMVLGFALHAGSYFLDLSPFLAIHAFGYGGIGLITLGMMSRVSLGHTGRNVYQPPKGLSLLFYALLLGVMARVFGPMMAPQLHSMWMGLSSLLWLLAYGGFCWLYLPMLCKPRLDKRPG